MSQRSATVDHSTTTSRKCIQCGLINFADVDQCKRCKSDLSQKSTGVESNERLSDTPTQSGRLKVSFVVLCGAGLALTLCLVFFFTKQAAATKPATAMETQMAEAVTPHTLPVTESPAPQTRRSEDATREVLDELKAFQSVAGSTMSYEEYDQKLTELKVLADEASASFGPADHTFGVEVEAAILDYTAAGKWWLTTIRNNKVFSEADRNEKTQAKWDSAKIHVENAEKALIR